MKEKNPELNREKQVWEKKTYHVFKFLVPTKKAQIVHKDINRKEERMDFDDKMERRLTELQKRIERSQE